MAMGGSILGVAGAGAPSPRAHPPGQGCGVFPRREAPLRSSLALALRYGRGGCAGLDKELDKERELTSSQ